jgi:hypothetical protein
VHSSLIRGNATDCNERRFVRRRAMREKSIDFQKLVLSIIRREEEEEEKKSTPRTHTHACIHRYAYTQYTRGNVLIICLLSYGKENLIKVHG